MGLKKIMNLPKNIREFGKTPDKFVTRHLQKSNSIQSIDLFPTQDCYLLSNPDEIEHVYLKNGKKYQRGVLFDPIRNIIGNGLPTSDGEFWLSQRRMMHPSFHSTVLPHYSAEMCGAINDMIDRWKKMTDEGTVVMDIEAEMMSLTSDITLRLLFSTEITKEKQDRSVLVLNEINKKALTYITNPLAPPLWIPTPNNLKFKRNMQEIHQTMDEVISKRKTMEGEKPNDLLQMLLDAVDEETGNGMDNNQLKSEVLNLFIAGTETTASVLTWTFYFLAGHRSEESKVWNEIKEIYEQNLPDLEAIRKMTYSDCVMKEVMRFYPPAWLLAREAMEDDKIGGITIKKGAQMLIPIRGMHMHPLYWENPEKFDPERFASNPKMEKFAYFPFGGGPHLCIGKEFARMEYMLALYKIMKEFDFDLTDQKVEPEILISLRPKDGLHMKVTANCKNISPTKVNQPEQDAII